MRNIFDFQNYKTKSCITPECPLKDEAKFHESSFEQYCECPGWHFKFDQRRSPFQDLKRYDLAYDFIKPKSNPEKGPISKLEYKYHPEVFKTEECANKKECIYKYCIKFHDAEEFSFWKNFRETLKNLKDKDGKLSEKILNLMQNQAFWNNESETKPEKKNSSSTGNFSLLPYDSFAILSQAFDEEEKRVDRKKVDDKVMNNLFKPLPSNFSSTSSGDINPSNSMPNYLLTPLTTENHATSGTQQQLKLTNQFSTTDLDCTIDNLADDQAEVLNQTMIKARDEAELKKNPYQGVYLYQRTVDMIEDERNEFKIYQNPKPYELQDIINKYVSGFLNHKGGIIYLGIDDDGYVVGVNADRRNIDEIRLELDNTLKKFDPIIIPSSYNICERKIWDEYKKIILNNKIIIEIHVQVGSPDELYFASNQKAYVRRQASCPALTPQEIKLEIKNRMKNQMIRKALEELKNPNIKIELEKMETSYLKDIKLHIKETYNFIKKVLLSRGDTS